MFLIYPVSREIILRISDFCRPTGFSLGTFPLRLAPRLRCTHTTSMMGVWHQKGFENKTESNPGKGQSIENHEWRPLAEAGELLAASQLTEGSQRYNAHCVRISATPALSTLCSPEQQMDFCLLRWQDSCLFRPEKPWRGVIHNSCISRLSARRDPMKRLHLQRWHLHSPACLRSSWRRASGCSAA